MRLPRPRSARLLGTLVLAGTVTGLGAAPAQAQEYRYWSFWNGPAAGAPAPSGDGGWSYATEGPATTRPQDGAVAGFRFTVSAGSAAAGRPRRAADFAAICARTPAQDGRKRVGLVLDFGTKADAPRGETPPAVRTECARLPEDGTVGDALAAVAGPLRYDANALLCAIAGYPEAGCAEKAGPGSGAGTDPGSGSGSGSQEPGASGSASAAGKQRDGDDSGGPSAGLIGGIAAVVVLGAAAGWQARRRRG
ncbi:SCO2322 family protein [Streptomyces sp. NPDC018019]|uniref:SCO2322 family protein n=1 Tax=Streptomyces sp. NPDC018019 TaxID=3365030 RepID=UPI0037B6908B